jgi:hypothetical protein
LQSLKRLVPGARPPKPDNLPRPSFLVLIEERTSGKAERKRVRTRTRKRTMQN